MFLRMLAAMLAIVTAVVAVDARAADKVAVAALRLISSAPVFIARDRGYFAAEGLDVEIKFFTAAQQVALAVASGDTQFGVTGLTAGFYSAAGAGTMKIVAAQSREEPGYKFNAYVASVDAYNKGLTKPGDLKGRIAGITTAGSTYHYQFGRLAEKYGFKLDDMTIKPLQTIPNMVAALKGNQVDVISIAANNAFQLEREGGGRIIGWVSEETPWQLGALFASTAVIDKNRDLVVRFIRAYVKGAADYGDALLQRDAAGNRVFGDKATAILPIFENYVEPKPDLELLKASANYIDPKGRLLVGDVYQQVNWYKAQGLLPPTIEPKTVIDLSFVPDQLDLPK